MSHDMDQELEPVANEDASRRDLVVGAVAGAAAAAIVAGSTAEAQTLTAVAPRRRSYQLAFTRRPSVRELQAVLGRMVGIAGCPACGLIGFDLRLRVDPEFQGQAIGDIARYG